MSTEREQKLIDIMFEVVMVSKTMQDMSNEVLALWVRRQLTACGFPTEPIGASWGVLVPKGKS